LGIYAYFSHIVTIVNQMYGERLYVDNLPWGNAQDRPALIAQSAMLFIVGAEFLSSTTRDASSFLLAPSLGVEMLLVEFDLL
jgi:hypothetical protein